ncbi:ABC-type spermidine/putrescine transport system ATPase component [Gaiella occulta]|uniref:ABC-type quaternary amine transporter n=1 Tax=Gaiella occulta TaxID=1002870 RepID=A0A7M2Z0V5_9ACTN|nr:ABC transporter ATP-binding protein [Gaiella occulta]RDI76038.1 ABC-type spermidine/putrescine transport system ATPase component [Gaiella occulta]
MLRIAGARVVFAGRAAVDDVDLEVGRGETTAVLGPSGCGKSTLLRAVAGLQRLDGGTVHIDGQDVTSVPAHRRGVGLMFQDDALFPHRDVAGNIAFGLRMAGASDAAAARRVAELLDLVGLAGLERRRVATLSGGERKRVALARALAPAPRVLLLDEPLGALDRPLHDRLLEELRAVFSALGLTVVYVTHDAGEAFAVGHRVAVMRAGRVVQVAQPDTLWSQPADAWVARFLGLANVEEDGSVVRVTRPEAVRLVADPAGGAVVSAVERDGPLVRLRAQLDDGRAIEAAATGVDHPAPGERVRVDIDPAGVVEIPRA